LVRVTDVSGLARAQRWSWFGGVLLKAVGVAAFFVIAWGINEGDWLRLAYAVPAISPVGNWFPLAVGVFAGVLAANCFWRLADRLARGSRVAAAIAAALATVGAAAAVTMAEEVGEALVYLLMALAALGWSAWLVLRTPLPSGGGTAASSMNPRLVRHRYRARTLTGSVIVILFCEMFALMVLLAFYTGLPPGLLGVVACAGVFGLFALVRRSRARAIASVSEVVEVDPRSPVVYLRSFAADRVLIRVQPSRHPTPLSWKDPLMHAPLEEVVAESLWRYGPVLAAAEPGAASSPLGAARAELGADGWEQTLLEWICAAQLIVVTVGRGQGLMWELARASEVGSASRVLFVIPPLPVKSRPKGGGGLIGLRTLIREEYDQRQHRLESDWIALCDALDREGAMWLPRDIDLNRACVVLPGCRRGRSDGPEVFAASGINDFSYEVALDVAARTIFATAPDRT